MRNYQLYLIVNEFASHYFGRERMFFQLFQEYEEAVGQYKSILKEQIQFITKPIQTLKYNKLLFKIYKETRHLYDNGTYYIEMD